VEQVSDVLVDLVELLYCISGRSLDHVLRLGNSYLLELNTSTMLDVLNQLLVFLRIESNAGSISACSGSSARSMDVSFDVLWRLNLDNEIYVGDIEPS
jgi:hypothetical protein